MQIEGVFMYSSELCEPNLTESPEIFDAVDMVAPIGKLILTMLDPIVLLISTIYKTVIGLEPIGVNHCFGVRFPLSN